MYSTNLPPEHAMSNSGKTGPKHLHIIGICGTATSALAIAFQRAGWKVTGSDKGFYPPISTALDNGKITYYAGWHVDKMTDAKPGEAVGATLPDVVMIGGSGKSSLNPEMIFAKEKGLPIHSFPEIIERYMLRKHSIVCAGTWGKTTSTALLSFILEKAKLDPTYMFGGLSLSQTEAARITDSDWNVLEGDEYTGSAFDNIAKFFHYHPTHLLLTSVSWDHADVYPTEALYIDAFRKLLKEVPRDASGADGRTGKIVACADNQILSILLQEESRQHVSYGRDSSAHYRYENVSHTKNGLSFDIVHGGKKYLIVSPMLGAYNAENITGCFAMACEIGIDPMVVADAIRDFAGLKRRLEKRLEMPAVKNARGIVRPGITVIDAHAPTPEKARAGLESLREVYKGKIVAIFEPNIGGRQRASQAMYDKAFAAADIVLVPRLTKLKVDATLSAADQPLEGDELTKILAKSHADVRFIENDDALVEAAIKCVGDADSTSNDNAANEDVIVFLGSHSFRGMIEAVVEKLAKK